MKLLTNFVLCLCLAIPAVVSAAPRPQAAKTQPAEPQQVVLRHALEGAPLGALAALTLRFNDAEAQRKTGRGLVRLEDARGVADRRHLPHLGLFNQDDAIEMFGAQPRFRPLHQLMTANRQSLDATRFYPQMQAAVGDSAGRMQALPLAHSLPALFYNKAAFERAGLDPAAPPRTWWEVQEAAGKLRDSGVQCPLTSSRFAWVHVENVAAQHGEPLVVNSGKHDRLALNNRVNVKHLALLTSWHRSLYFIYSGPGNAGDDRFASGECAMLTGAAAFQARLLERPPDFPVGVAVLPHHDDVRGVQPGHVLADGAALWVLAADGNREQQVIARFIAFLMRPEVQRDWVRATGFLPMSPAAMQALRESGTDPGLFAKAEARLASPKRTAVRTKSSSDRVRIRNILNEEIEFVWGHQQPPKAALDAAVARAAAVLAPAKK